MPSVPVATRRAIAERQTFVSTNLLIAETHALVARRVGESAALTLLDQLRRDPLHEDANDVA